jgi:hypothetical protein
MTKRKGIKGKVKTVVKEKKHGVIKNLQRKRKAAK